MSDLKTKDVTPAGMYPAENPNTGLRDDMDPKKGGKPGVSQDGKKNVTD